jgi:DNA-binding MurR/RpiR family transcriptional regulator
MASKRGIFAQLEEQMTTFTPSESAIASYLLNKRAAIPFETAASLAKKLGLSAMTVGRFARSLGYLNFNKLKQQIQSEVRMVPWLTDNQMDSFFDEKDREPRVRASLERQVAAIVEAYDASSCSEWTDIVRTIAKARRVFVAGFQPERGTAASLAYLLQYARPGVHLVDISAGHFSEVLVDKPTKSCLIVIDIHRHSKLTKILIEGARDAGLSVILLTDQLCEWGRGAANHMLSVTTDTGLFFASTAAMTALCDLLVDGVVKELGASVAPRLDAISASYDSVVGFAGLRRQASRRPGG